MPPVIDVVELQKAYRDGWWPWRRSRFAALQGVTLSVQRGEVFGLLGPNGAGKTTFVKILLGIVRATNGTATLLGEPAGRRTSRRHIGYLPENLFVPRHHTGRSALRFYGQLSGLSLGEVGRRSDEVLEFVGLRDRAAEPVRKYSKGMLQRLGLAQALLHDPDLLILDEPTDGLDPLARTQVRSVLRTLAAAGKTIFLNSHLLQEVELVCDRVAILDRGVLRGLGSVEELRRHDRDQIELELELLGAVDAITSVLGPGVVFPVDGPGLPNGARRVQLTVTDQAAVDDRVDALRRAGISLVSLARRQRTLEDVFLTLLESQGTTADARLRR